MKKRWQIVNGLIVALLLVGCGQEEDVKSTAAKGNEESVQKIIVGTGTQFTQICFIDKNGELTGYDIEVVKAIDELLPEYEFEFQTMEFSNLLLSLETNKIDFIAHQMEVNDERQEKFLFNEEPYNVFPLKVTVHEDNTDIQSAEDLVGKKVGVTATSNSAVLIEQYKKDNNIDLKVVYTNNAIEDLRVGRIDATISTPFAAAIYNENANAQQKVVGDALSNSKVYFLFDKQGQELSNRIDEALKELKATGVISELSEKWLGADYTVEF